MAFFVLWLTWTGEPEHFNILASIHPGTELSPHIKMSQTKSPNTRCPLDSIWAQSVVWDDRNHVQSSVEASGCIQRAGGPGDSL